MFCCCFVDCMTAGNTTEYVNSVIRKVGGGDPTGGLNLPKKSKWAVSDIVTRFWRRQDRIWPVLAVKHELDQFAHLWYGMKSLMLANLHNMIIGKLLHCGHGLPTTVCYWIKCHIVVQNYLPLCYWIHCIIGALTNYNIVALEKLQHCGTQKITTLWHSKNYNIVALHKLQHCGTWHITILWHSTNYIVALAKLQHCGTRQITTLWHSPNYNIVALAKLQHCGTRQITTLWHSTNYNIVALAKLQHCGTR